MAQDADLTLAGLRVDGGMTASDMLLQIQADVLDIPVTRPEVIETTCLGAAYAAGLAVGFWSGTDELRSHWRAERTWQPALGADEREAGERRWRKAVARTLDWV